MGGDHVNQEKEGSESPTVVNRKLVKVEKKNLRRGGAGGHRGKEKGGSRGDTSDTGRNQKKRGFKQRGLSWSKKLDRKHRGGKEYIEARTKARTQP